MITVLAGGIGGARFIRGVAAAVGADKVTAIVNVGDDLDHVGLRVCPDLDSITYWLAGLVHPEQQWGRADEHHVVSEELARFGHPRWFTLGDRDLAVHLHRTHLMRQGVPLSRATDEIRQAFGIDVQLLPATDDPVATRIKTADGRDLAFQEYWVREQASPVVTDVYLSGASLAAPAPGVLDAIHRADTVLIAPSNPVVSIGTILAIPGIDDAVRSTSAPVVGVSPIIGGKVVRGMADRLLPAVGAQVSADGVARHYGSLLDGWVIDEADRNLCATIEASGITCQATDTMLDDIEVARTVALTCLQLAAELAEQGHRP